MASSKGLWEPRLCGLGVGNGSDRRVVDDIAAASRESAPF
jgi:hypothetical protein